MGKKKTRKKATKKQLGTKKPTSKKKSQQRKRAGTKKKAVKKKIPAVKSGKRELNEDIPNLLSGEALSGIDAEFVAAILKNATAVKKVLPKVSNINKRIGGKKGFTALMLAAYSAPDSTIKLLIKHGANPKVDPVLLATTFKSTTQLLLKAGADPNVNNGDETPLLNAIELSDRSTASILLDNGAKVTDAVARYAKRLNDAGISELLGLNKPAPSKLFIPPLLPKPLKAAYQKVYDVTGWPPLGVEGMTIFRCQIEPGRFLDSKQALSSVANQKAADMVAQQLAGSVDGVEFVRSNSHNECVLMLGSKNKFVFWKKPKKVFDWLKSLDAAHPMTFVSVYSETSKYQFKKKLTQPQINRWKKAWSEIKVDGISAKLSKQELKLQIDGF